NQLVESDDIKDEEYDIVLENEDKENKEIIATNIKNTNKSYLIETDKHK
ncbi:16157_t:CDS:1, partial [Dentiscutata heterogama]